MLRFLRKNPKEPDVPAPVVESSNVTETPQVAQIEADDQVNKSSQSWLARLQVGLGKTRQRFTDQVTNLLLGHKVIDQDLLDDLEALLLSADLGVAATQTILDDLSRSIARKELANPEALWAALRAALIRLLTPCESQARTLTEQPFIFLMVGVNGAGKTTTLGKLAHHFKQQGHSVMLAAGDTFRAAAIEQLQSWGERNQIPVIAQQTGADSASVLFDAVKAAKARNIDILLADTAGRLHNKDHLMEELKKIKRVLDKAESGAPHEICLVLDAGIGQNGLQQAEQFHQALGLTSIILTKLDGTAKGGILFAIAEKFKLPIHFIGIGEQLTDLRPFSATEFIDGLIGDRGQRTEDRKSSALF